MTALRSIRLAAFGVGLASCLLAPATAEETVRIGIARSVSNGAELIAIEKGYFREAGIKVEIDDIDTSANTIALLATNRLQIIAGGISAGYFNAIEKNLPITIIADRVSTPIGHNLMLRPDLKDKVTSLEQLKGKVIGSNGAGSVSTYEVGKMLETAGLAISDVDVKIFPFTQMAVAFANKAIDAGIVIPPFVSEFLEQGHAVGFAEPDTLVKPSPMTIAVIMVNTDWAKKNTALLRNYYTAYLRGVRDYCNAYHGSPVKEEIVAALIRHGSERRPELLYKYPWPARSANGRINIASMLDMQDWFIKNGFARAKFPAERLVDLSYADFAVQKLGPFAPANKESKLEGCR
ncbi:MAG TPA: ABC transporter substrate-binding protein [Xanthobacteraceae bacterium]|nr:ABC transporter substrate-binding protein [Xanthobacteraceae bacterium]